ncbi:MAG: hypothetical protein ACD_33C00041G0004 [uncultured bacterium]|nr:MAG: hypothetical protein ACD_33C00041G0004 [uncultured bacterium]
MSALYLETWRILSELGLIVFLSLANITQDILDRKKK